MLERKIFCVILILVALFSKVHLRSRYYGPAGENNYPTDKNINKCLKVEDDFTEEEQETKKDKFKAACLSASKDCIFIEGKTFINDGRKNTYDCYYNKYSENATIIRDFWNTNPQDFAEEENIYQVCTIYTGSDKSETFPCNGKSQWVNDDGTSDYDYDDNPCGNAFENIDMDNTNETELRKICINTKPSTDDSFCSFVTGKYLTETIKNYDCVWNKYKEDTYQIRVNIFFLLFYLGFLENR